MSNINGSFFNPSYENCQYVATAAISSLSDSTDFDLAGNTLAVNDRALFPYAGTYVGIFAWSGTAWVVDPAFVVREGATVDVIRGTSGATQWRQTAATGSGTAIFLAFSSSRARYDLLVS